jgi:N-acetylneuraminate synthase
MLADKLDLPVLKIPSGEITNPLLLLAAAHTGKPVILSTGMTTLDEVEQALGVLAFGYLPGVARPSKKAFRDAFKSKEGQRLLRENVTVLHCTTEYPAPFAELNLRAMSTLRDTFGLRVGYSDHSEGIAAPIAAVALGAAVIEKHFTLDRGMEGPDHKASLEPNELVAMIRAIRAVELALGDGKKEPTASEIKNIRIARKSLAAATAIRKGETFSEDNLTFKRPGDGTSPFDYWEYLGKTARKDYAKDDLI